MIAWYCMFVSGEICHSLFWSLFIFSVPWSCASSCVMDPHAHPSKEGYTSVSTCAQVWKFPYCFPCAGFVSKNGRPLESVTPWNTLNIPDMCFFLSASGTGIPQSHQPSLVAYFSKHLLVDAWSQKEMMDGFLTLSNLISNNIQSRP